MTAFGTVIIGRNEGERLVRCLASVRDAACPIVYVDSGSTDGSVDAASRSGADVVRLATSRPFTAARARNAGLERLLATHPRLEFVQFVDGDCEVHAGWLARAEATLAASPDAAAVCGRRRERHPEATLYNRLCDMEWDTPIGEALACGGDAMYRVAALREVGGFNGSLIAGEEPELCLRIRRRGHRILRIDAEMTLHDAAMVSFGQWWRRALRAGHAFAEGAYLHGASRDRHWVRETASALAWGACVPALALALAIPTAGLSLGVAAVAYAAQLARTWARAAGRWPARTALVGAGFNLLAKFPQAVGVLRFAVATVQGRRHEVIGYKGP